MLVNVNHKEITTEAQNLGELVAQLELPSQGVAVAVGNKLVCRVDWDAFQLEEGAQITIIKAACGG